jgi:hypothetical protein
MSVDNRYEAAMNWASQTKGWFGIGKFQLFAGCCIVWGIGSANYLIFPLAYLELYPKFVCTYRSGTARQEHDFDALKALTLNHRHLQQGEYK